MKNKGPRAFILRHLPVILLSLLSMAVALACGTRLGHWDAPVTDLFMRWRHALRDGGAPRAEMSLVAIDRRTQEVHGLYGRGEWLSRRPFVDQVSTLLEGAAPSVLAYDILFYETAGTGSNDGTPVERSVTRLRNMAAGVGELAARAEYGSAGSSPPLSDDTLADMSLLVAGQGDLQFARALASADILEAFPVVLGYNFRGGTVDPQPDPVEPWSDDDVFGSSAEGDETRGARLRHLRRMSIPAGFVHFPGGRPDASYGFSPNAALPKGSFLSYSRLGYINVPRDEDGVIRRVPMVVGLAYNNSVTGEDKTMFVPSFALVSAMLHLGIEFPLDPGAGKPPIEVHWGKEIILRPPGRQEVTVKIGRDCSMYVDFTHLYDEFDVVSFGDSLHRGGTARLSGRLVMVGVATTAVDVGPCPVESNTPLLHVHAMAAENILSGRTIRELTEQERWMLLALVWVIATATYLAERSSRMALAGLVQALVYGLVAYAGIHLSRLVLPMVVPAVYLGASAFLIMAYRYAVEERERRRIRGMFSTMVSSEVLRYLEQNPGSFSLEGHNVDATIMFADISGFSAMSERLAPRELTGFLNSYLTVATDCLMEHGAYIDKFVGDLIMAVWGAPFQVQDHAMKACTAALEYRRVVREHNPEWERRYGFRVSVRWGLASGTVAAGNMGSDRKRQYTVMGDVVNVASRLEPINKDYGTDIIVAETTRNMVMDRMLLRPLDRIVVLGKTEAVTIYEVIGVRGEVEDAIVERAAAFEEALELYFRRDWQGTCRILEGIIALGPDEASSNLMRRAQAYSHRPPRESWQGEYQRKGKE